MDNSMSNKIGGMIYTLRKLKGLTQDELGAVLSVSGTAVSKWERGISYPDIEIVCKMADIFHVTTDELFGRDLRKVEELGSYRLDKIEVFETACQLMECYRISRGNGLLALEEKADNGELQPFVTFVIKKIFDFYREEIPQDKIKGLLYNYVKWENNRVNAEMAVEAVMAMFEGVSENTMREITASYIEKEYYESFLKNEGKLGAIEGNGRYFTEEILNSYSEKEEKAAFIEEIGDYSDEEIRLLIKNIDNVTLVNALYGASGRVCRKFLANVSDRLLFFINEDIKNCNVDMEEIREAQREILRRCVALNIMVV